MRPILIRRQKLLVLGVIVFATVICLSPSAWHMASNVRDWSRVQRSRAARSVFVARYRLHSSERLGVKEPLHPGHDLWSGGVDFTDDTGRRYRVTPEILRNGFFGTPGGDPLLITLEDLGSAG